MNRRKAWSWEFKSCTKNYIIQNIYSLHGLENIGVERNEKADSWAKEATQDHLLNGRFIPFPHSYLKYKLKHNLIQNWQQRWDQSQKSPHVQYFFPKVNKSVHITSRELIIFLRNPGPFQKCFYKIAKRSKPLCICNHLSGSLHYILICPLT